MYHVLLLFVIPHFVVEVYTQTRTVTVIPATFNVGEDATMTCTYTLEPGDVLAGLTWYKADDNELQNGSPLVSTGITVNGRYSLSNNRDLIITNVEVNDAGNYLCRVTVTITFDNAEDVGMLSVNCENTQTRTITVSPATFNVGEDATMTCTYTLAPEDVLAGLGWFKADEGGNQDGSLLVSTGSTVNGRYSLSSNNRDLIITNVDVSDAGNYLCRITLAVTFANADDFEMMSINYINGNLAIAVNSYTAAQNVIITCSGSVAGDPAHVINLYRDNTTISTQTALPLTYTIATVSENDGGMYRCEASNTAGTVTSNILQLDYYIDGSLTIDVNNSTAAHNVIITCSGSIDGSPDPDINLYRDNTNIKTQSTLPLTYTIATVSENDGGIYRCEAGTVTSNTMQLHYYKPAFDSIEDKTVFPNETVTFKIENLSYNPNDVIYKWTIDDPHIDYEDGDPTLAFTLPVMKYTIKLNVTNSIGSTIDSTTVTVQTDPFKPCECEETTAETGNNSPGLVIGMFFVGMFVGTLGLSIGFLMYTKTTQKQTTDKEKTEKKKQDTYMEYMVDRPTDGENQTYQDLQHKVEESAYVNVKAGNKNKGLKA